MPFAMFHEMLWAVKVKCKDAMYLVPQVIGLTALRPNAIEMLRTVEADAGHRTPPSLHAF